MILTSPALDTAIPLPKPPPAGRPEPSGFGRPDRTAPASGTSFRDALHAAETVQRRSAPADTEHGEKAVERVDSPSDETPVAANACDHRPEAEHPAEVQRSVDRLIEAVLQAVAAVAGPSCDAPDAVATEPEADTEAPEQAHTELLTLLQEIREAQQVPGSGAGDASGIAVLLEKLDALSSANPQAALPGKVHQMLRDLREHLSGIAWGRAVKGLPAGEGSTPSQPPATDTAANGTAAAEAALADVDVPESVLPTGPRVAIQAEAAKDAALRKSAVERQAASSEPAPVTGRGTGTTAESADRPAPAAAASVRAAGQPSEPPAFQHPWAQADRDAGRTPDAVSAPAVSGPRTEPKAATAAELPPADVADPGDQVEQPPGDARLTRVHDGRPERAFEAGAAGRDKEAAGASRAGVFDQIVQRAVLQVKNEQSEIKIDLKPEFLGNVRMQIVSENQQVSVRILTEAPAVRDMIETGLQQLRSELQSQGLQVDRLEVAVSDDYREPRRRQEKAGERSGNTAPAGEVDETERSTAGGRVEPAYFRQRPSARRSTVDMFV